MYHRYHHHIQNEKKKKSKPHLIKTLLEKKSNYFKVRNIIAFMLKWPKKYRKEAFTSLQDRSELKIFELFQAESVDWCKTFRGNGFYTITDNNGITTVMGRKTYAAPDGLKLRLVPPKNILYKRITWISWYARIPHLYPSSDPTRRVLSTKSNKKAEKPTR